jgi:hypothetical protein
MIKSQTLGSTFNSFEGSHLKMNESEEELLHQNNTDQYQDLGFKAHKSIQLPLMKDRG